MQATTLPRHGGKQSRREPTSGLQPPACSLRVSCSTAERGPQTSLYAPAVCVPHSSTKTSLSGSTAAATVTLQAALKNSSRSVAERPLFPGGAQAGYGATHGGAAYREPPHELHVVAAISEGGKGALFLVLLQELDGSVVQPRGGSGALLRSQGLSPAGLVRVSLDRGETHGEGAGRLSLGHAAFYRGDNPPP